MDYVSETSSFYPHSARLSASAKRTPRAPTVPVEVRLYSLNRSSQRDDFNRKLRVKETEKEEHLRREEEERQRQMEEEIKQIRSMSTFKATPIRKYRDAQAPNITERALTVPAMPKLSTLERAQLREDVQTK